MPLTRYVNGAVTVPGGAVAKAFAVRGDRFVAVGTADDVLALGGPGARTVDLRGAAIIPGLADSHDHFWSAGTFLDRGVDLVGVTDWPEIRRRLQKAVAAAEPGAVVFTTTGWALRPLPTRADLDAISAAVPIALVAYRRGTAVLNSAALARLGIGAATPSFRGARVPVDGDGEPTGGLPAYPVGVQLLEALLPPRSPAEQEALVERAMRQRNALGITSVRELSLPPEALPLLQRLRDADRLTLRIAAGLEFADQADTVALAAALPAPRRDDDWLFVDCIGEEPWTPGTMDVEQYTEVVLGLRRLGWRPAPHVSADAARGRSTDDAIAATLAAYEAVDRVHPLAGERWYIEHASLSGHADDARMARLGLVVSTQFQGYRPGHAAPLPADRLDHANPVASWLRRGIVVVGGSDAAGPTPAEPEPNDLFELLRFFVTRRAESGAVDSPSEAVGRHDALRVLTEHASYAVFQEARRGRIAAGMLADFLVLDRDLFTVPDEEIAGVRPVATYAGGRRVFATPAAPDDER